MTHSSDNPTHISDFDRARVDRTKPEWQTYASDALTVSLMKADGMYVGSAVCKEAARAACEAADALWLARREADRNDVTERAELVEATIARWESERPAGTLVVHPNEYLPQASLPRYAVLGYEKKQIRLQGPNDAGEGNLIDAETFEKMLVVPE